MEGRTENFTPRGQSSPLGAKLRMGLWKRDANAGRIQVTWRQGSAKVTWRQGSTQVTWRHVVDFIWGLLGGGGGIMYLLFKFRFLIHVIFFYFSVRNLMTYMPREKEGQIQQIFTIRSLFTEQGSRFNSWNDWTNFYTQNALAKRYFKLRFWFSICIYLLNRPQESNDDKLKHLLAIDYKVLSNKIENKWRSCRSESKMYADVVEQNKKQQKVVSIKIENIRRPCQP
jgi:hypothetical protein